MVLDTQMTNQDLQAMHSHCCSDPPYTPSYDGLYGRGPTWKQQQNLDRLWEQHRVKLLSRSFLIEQLCQWSIDTNIPMSKATWDGDMEVSPP